MSPGKLKDRIAIQQRTTGRNGYGEAVNGWADLAKVWAEVKSLRGFERTESYLVNAKSAWRIVIRTRADVTTAMRVSARGLTLEIKSALPIGNTHFTELICEALP